MGFYRKEGGKKDKSMFQGIMTKEGANSALCLREDFLEKMELELGFKGYVGFRKKEETIVSQVRGTA